MRRLHSSFIFLAIIALTSLSGCGFFAAKPSVENLHAEWTVNEGRQRTLGPDTPIVFRLTLVNTSGRHVKLPVRQLKPVLVAGQPVTVENWVAPEKVPGILGPHESWEGAWVPEAEFPAGSYTVRASEKAGFRAGQCEFTITGTPTPPPLRLYYANTANRLTNDTEEAILELRERLAAGDSSPGIRLQLADLLAASGHPHEARAHYEGFARSVFGPEEKVLPAWLEARMEGEAEDSSPEPP